jgi:AbrB family looped-hinge helix DNA binding protein
VPRVEFFEHEKHIPRIVCFYYPLFGDEIIMGNKVKVQKTKNDQYIVTIPKTLAELFDIEQGTLLEFKVNEKGEIVLKRG